MSKSHGTDLEGGRTGSDSCRPIRPPGCIITSGALGSSGVSKAVDSTRSAYRAHSTIGRIVPIIPWCYDGGPDDHGWGNNRDRQPDANGDMDPGVGRTGQGQCAERQECSYSNC